MVHDTAPRRSHLRVVGDTPATDGIDLGVTYEQPADEAPLEGTLVTAEDTTAAVTPAKASLDAVNSRLRASLEASHTYALLAWARWMDATTGYVMDPDLRQDMIDDAERDLDRKRVRAAKQLTRSLDATKRAAAEREVQRLKNRQVSELEVDARVLSARGKRLARRFAVPAAVVAGPIAAAVMGGPLICFLAWPAAWAWLALQGRAHARAELGTTTISPLEEKARHLATGTPAPEGQEAARVVGASEEENRLLARLGAWEDSADGRGLTGVTPLPPTIDTLGIRVVLALSGSVTPKSLEKKMPAIRAALSVPRGTRTDLSEGEYGDQAVLRIRTRTPERDMVWRPGRRGIGLDTETGRPVVLPKGRMLIAGTSGAGKSVLVRVAIAEALTSEEPTAVVYIDPKGEESALWRGKIRTATTPEEIMTLLWELNEESESRSLIMQDQGVSAWTPTPVRPRIVVFVDEGAEIVSMHDVSPKDPKDHVNLLGPLQPLATMGRSRAIDLKWATQKPLLGSGIPSQLNGVMQDRVVLKTAGRNENNQVLGSDWKSHELELGGFALTNVAGRGPGQPPIQVWDLSDDAAVADVPGGAVWRYRPDPEAATEREIPRALAAALELLGDRGGVRSDQIAEELGVSETDVYREMLDAGVKAGRFTPAPGEKQERGYRREDLLAAADYGQ